ncbi:hypothetical protein [Actinophytocola sp.]|uniref:hypothetical protein n=1 Tax=Actinophytocola sp. TaxID=1872138 RepID=UPI002D55340B|nr:hypothetical protein [Actinophytocola sp.]HYQ68064.1 hypothetical protein [Actinophytocola sp.]
MHIGDVNLLAGAGASEVDHVAAVGATVDRLRRRNRSTRPRIMAAHPGVSVLVDRLTSGDVRRVLVVHGQAGSGKSTVVVEAIDRVLAMGWAVSAVRMDAVEQVVLSAQAVGGVFELSDSPVVSLASAAEESPSLLVVDQLDAVSLYSGRMPDSFDAVTEMLEQAQAYPAMKVLVVVRTVDLHNDPRMRSLLDDPSSAESVEIGELTPDAVRQALTEAGVNPKNLDTATSTLLQVPLHLAIFLHLPVEARTSTYRTLPELYEQFTRQIRRVTEKDAPAAWQQTTNTLVSYMSDHESLQAPSAVLDGVPIGAVSALVSAGMLVDDGATMAFFHETYFDFLFARAFVTQGRDLHDFLATSGQHLFRRGQTRQVLEHLKAVAPERFRQTVVRLMASDTIRVHLLDIVLNVLRAHHPTAEDWLALEPLAFNGTRRTRRLVGLLRLPQWFDAADATGRWEDLLSDPTTADVAVNQLVIAARDRAERAAELVRPYIGVSNTWNNWLRVMVTWSLTPGLVDLAVELIDRGLLDDVRGSIAINSDFWSIVSTVKHEDPAGAARVVGAYLRRAWDRALIAGRADPFHSGYLSDTTGGGETTIKDIAIAAPEQVLAEVLPFISTILDVTATSDSPDDLRHGRLWRYRTLGPHTVHDALFEGVEHALITAAPHLHAAADPLIHRLATSDLEPMRFLACRAYTALADQAANEAVDWLLTDSHNLRLGWLDSPAWATRQLIEAATAHCDDDRIEALSTRLLDHYPARELKAENLRLRGHRQYELLSAIRHDRLPELPRRRLQELDRKFGPASLAPPQPMKFEFVPSPVPERATPFMTDENWDQAIRTYRDEQSRWVDTGFSGGAPELAALFGRQAASEPERFAQLVLTLDHNTHPAYLEHAIEALTGTVPADLLAQVCVQARTIADEAVGQVICRAIAAVAAEAVESMIDLLEHYAHAEDPNTADTSVPDYSSDSYQPNWLEDAAINCVRGLCARAIGYLLTAQPEHAQRLLPTIAALAADPVLAVRAQAARAVRALLTTHPEQALQLADTLFTDTEPTIFDSDNSMKLLLATLKHSGDHFTQYLAKCLTAATPIADRAGQIWAVALINKQLSATSPIDPAALPPAAKNGAAKVFANMPNARPEFVKAFFNDEDPEVRKTATNAMRHLKHIDIATARDLVASFTSSAAFPENYNTLFHTLEQSTSLLPETLLAASTRVIDTAGDDLGDIRTAAAAISRDIITVVLRLYHQGDRHTRTACLDIIDRLSDVGALGLDEALSDEC